MSIGAPYTQRLVLTQCAPVMALHSGGEQLLRIADCQVYEVRQRTVLKHSSAAMQAVQRQFVTQVAGQHQTHLARDAVLSVAVAEDSVYLQVILCGCLLRC